MNSAAKKWIVYVACAVVAAAICVTLWFTGRTKGEAETNSTPSVAAGEEARLESGEVRRQPRGKERKGRKSVEARNPASPASPVPDDPDDDDDDDDDDGLTPEERALSKHIEDLDEANPEDLKKAVACAKEALNCPNAEVRQDMVNALGRFGEKGLPQLTPFLADPDEDVRDSAMNEWSTALSEIEDEPEKLGIVELAMGILTDEEALEEIADEYIGADEKLAVESLLRIIEGGGSEEGIAKAKETYEFVTGDEFTDRAAAEKWIAEEYVPDKGPQQEQMK